MRRHAWLVLLVAGCGQGDDRGRLAPKTAAVVVSADPGENFVQVEGVPNPTLIEAGTRVMVIGDDERSGSPARLVVILARRSDLRSVGPTADVSVMLPRNCLRPAR